MKTSLQAMALQYAKEELGLGRPEVYGYRPDPQVSECAAVWLRHSDSKPGSKRTRWEQIGLIVHLEDGVLEEFDPEVDGQPGKLHSTDNCDLSHLRVQL